MPSIRAPATKQTATLMVGPLMMGKKYPFHCCWYSYITFDLVCYFCANYSPLLDAFGVFTGCCEMQAFDWFGAVKEQEYHPSDWW